MPRHFGSQGLILEGVGEIVTDRFGLDTGKAYWQAPTAQALVLAPQLLSAHPDASYMKMERRVIQFAPPFARIIGDYVGIMNNETTPVYELVGSVSEEPIQTHPEFDDIAGTPDDPAHGAIFVDENGYISFDPGRATFSHFAAIVEGEKNELAGVTAYLDPGQVVWRKTWITRTRPTDISQLGEIDSPEGNPPSLGSGKNWLYYALRFEQRGEVYQVNKEWKASGRGGWNSLIYSH